MKQIIRDGGRWITTAALLMPFAFQVESAAPNEANEVQSAPPLVRQIPGITAPDQFPRGCVDCHVYYPDTDLDVRLSTILAKWTNAVASPLLERMQAMAPAKAKLKGVHPALPPAALDDLPAACQRCHAKLSAKVPTLGQMMHVIHLSGTNDGHFLSIFQGECTHCHKLNLETGIWHLPNGAEQADARPKSKDKTGAFKLDSRLTNQRTDEETFYLIAFPLFLILFLCAVVCLGFGMLAWSQGEWKDPSTNIPPQQI